MTQERWEYFHIGGKLYLNGSTVMQLSVTTKGTMTICRHCVLDNVANCIWVLKVYIVCWRKLGLSYTFLNTHWLRIIVGEYITSHKLHH